MSIIKPHGNIHGGWHQVHHDALYDAGLSKKIFDANHEAIKKHSQIIHGGHINSLMGNFSKESGFGGVRFPVNENEFGHMLLQDAPNHHWLRHIISENKGRYKAAGAFHKVGDKNNGRIYTAIGEVDEQGTQHFLLPRVFLDRVHNHELGHAVDHYHGYQTQRTPHSKTDEFFGAYMDEIIKPSLLGDHPIGKYATYGANEGFAEAYRLLNNGDQGEDIVKKKTPKIYEYMKNKVFS